MIRTVPVQVFLDSTIIGSGVLEYEDECAPMIFDTVKSKCSTADLYIDSERYENAIQFCYEDKVAYGLGGVDSKTIKIPVYIDSNVVGEAEIPFVDSYSFTVGDTLLSIVAMALMTRTITLLIRLGKKSTGR